MDTVYVMLSIAIMVAVATIVIFVARRYQRVRVETGYHTGRFYNLRQHIGAFLGNYAMDQYGVGNGETDGRVDTNEEMFYFSDSDQ